jgi:hypothetical protein
MNKKFIILGIAAVMVTAIGCKKSSTNTTTTTFKADTAFTVIAHNAFMNYSSWSSIAFDAVGNKIFYVYPNTTEGFQIDLYDIGTGAYTTIYKHFTQSGQTVWHTSNGSEGMRLRYFSNTFNGNELIVPGGATNAFIVEIKVNADYSTTFLGLDMNPSTSNGHDVRDPYDADLVKTATANQISVLSMWNSVYSVGAVYPAYTVSPTSHGSSIVGTPGGMEYVFCGDNKSLDLYNNGVFVRSVNLTYGETQLQMDSKKRIYAYNGTVVYRFSSDLLTKEEFPVKGSLSGYREEAMVIREMPKWVQIYSFSQQDLIGMKLPL